MIEILSITPLVLVALAVYWRGRLVLRHVDDPSFPQLHFGKSQFLGNALALGMIISMLLSFRASGAKLLLLVVAVLSADYPYRRKLFGETWGFVRYLGFQLRFGFVTFGLLLCIALLPVVARSTGTWAVPVAVVLALLTAAAMHGHPLLARWILRAQPLGFPELKSRFAEVVAKADTRVPHVWRFAARGGHLMNAFAMTSLYRPAVLFSQGLLEAVGPREATAIFAHEVAHLEETTRGKRLRGEVWAGIQLALGVLFVVFLGPGVLLGDLLQWLWALVIFVLATRQGQSREAEFRSDLRAVELCGDPQALIDGLDKIHLLNHQPRHWNSELAAKLTHPSLAQRVRAIREASGLDPGADATEGDPGAAAVTTTSRENTETTPGTTTPGTGSPPAAPANDLVVVSTDGSGTLVALTAERVHWMRGVPQGTPLTVPALLEVASDLRTLRYGELSDLRYEVRGLAREHRLLAIQPGEKPLGIGLGAEVVPQLKRHLRTVDHLLTSTARGAQPPSAGGLGSFMLRLDGFLMAILALFPFSGPLLMMGLAVVLYPSQVALAAAGAIAVLGSLVELGMGWESWFLEPEVALISLVTRIVFGSLLLFGAWQRYRRGDVDPRGTPWIALLPLLSVVTLSTFWGGLRFLVPFPWEQLYRWAEPGPALLFAGFGLVAGLATLRRRWVWLVVVPWGLLALGVLLVGRSWFVNALGEDRWFDPGPSTQWPALELEDVRTVTASDRLAELELSAEGRLLLRSYPDDFVWGVGEESANEFAVELEPDHWWTFDALDASFLDDDRLLVLEDGDDHLRLSVRSLLPSTDEGFEIRLQRLEAPRLTVRVDEGGWQVTGIDRDADEAVVLITGERVPGVSASGGLAATGASTTGDLAGTVPRIRRWRLPAEDLGFSPHLVTPRGAVAVTMDFSMDGPASWILWSGGTLGQNRVERLIPEDRPAPEAPPLSSSCEILCSVLSGETGQLVCVAADSERSTLWSVILGEPELDPASEAAAIDQPAGKPWTLEPLARFPASYGIPEVQPDGRVWIAGVDSASVLYDPATGEGWRVRRQDTTAPESADGASSGHSRTDPVSRWLDQTFTDWQAGAWIVHGASHGDFVALAAYDESDGSGLDQLEITVTRRRQP